MSPLKLIIPGRYWDSQVYRGRIYPFGRDGEICQAANGSIRKDALSMTRATRRAATSFTA